MEELILEIRPAGRAKVDLIIRDTKGAILLTDQANLASIEGRKKVAKELSRKLQDRGIERTPPQLEEILQTTWNQHLQARERQEAEAAAAAAQVGEEDIDAREQRRLENMPADVRNDAEFMLRDPCLVERIVSGVEAQGVAGERELAVTLYLVGTSRKLPRPLAALVKGPTSSGKSYIMDKVAQLMPPESVIFATQMTPQALFHMKPDSLRHKLIIAGERSRKEDDEAAEASRALREMISSGRLSKLMPVKLGNELVTVLIEQEGPIAYAESTTLNAVFDEDENRCISLFTDERKEQTRRILARLGDSYASAAATSGVARGAEIHRAVQRMLARKQVLVPYAPKLAELMPDDRVEARRAFPHLVSLIQASALLHQFQREQDEAGRVIAAREDYRLAQYLLNDSMRRLLGGGLSDPAARFHDRLREWFDCQEFTTREARAKERTSRSSVYGWLGELSRVGALEQVQAARGSMPASWRVVIDGVKETMRNVLPAEEDVLGPGP
jgi:hypothetical protein